MNETVTVTLHGERDTTVTSQRFEVHGQGWFSSIEIGSVTIFAPVELLRRIADEATRAAMIAEGWAPPVKAPHEPSVVDSSSSMETPAAARLSDAGTAAAAEFPF